MSKRVDTVIKIKQANFTLHRAGAGEPLLYLHGIHGAASSFRVMESLARYYDVYLPEHPGFDSSDMPEWFESIHDLAYYYLDFLDALGLEHVHLAGHSLGGWIALEAAIRDPRRFRSLTLISSAGIHVKGVPKGDLFVRAPEVVFKSMFADENIAVAIMKEGQSKNNEDTFIKNRFATARAGWHPPMFNPHLAKWLERVRLPVRIIWGDCDRIFPIEYAHAFHRLLPDSTIDIIPACGHLAHIEQPHALVKSITSFIGGLPK